MGRLKLHYILYKKLYITMRMPLLNLAVFCIIIYKCTKLVLLELFCTITYKNKAFVCSLTSYINT